MSSSPYLAIRLYRGLWAAIDWLYPPICAGCGAGRTRWCAQCSSSVKLVEPPICPKCGDIQQNGQICSLCTKNQPHFASLRSWAIFEGALRQAIHKFKYERDLTLGDLFAHPMIELVYKMDWKIDLVIPVPLSRKRFNERGYNQSAFLAWPIALGIAADYSSKALTRNRDTRSQVGLNADERRDNVANAFIARPTLVSQKSILLIDDVTTTGSTIDACAAALNRAGARNVYGLTLARATLT